MFTASKYNTGKAGRFSYRTPEGVPFKKLKELPTGQVVTVRSLYINTKSKYGEEPVAVTDAAVINLPKHMLDTVKTMINDSECVEAVNAGLVGIKPYEYEGKNGHGVSAEWVDIAPEIPYFES